MKQNTLTASISYHPWDAIDFRKDQEKAKKWGEEKFSDWLSKLTVKEKNNLSFLIKDIGGHVPQTKINKYLKQTDGKLLTIAEGENDAIKKMIKANNDIIHAVDLTLSKIKIPKAINVYHRLKNDHFFPQEPIRQEKDSLININAFTKIKNEFQGKMFTDVEYKIASLIDPLVRENRLPILMKIKIPAGLHVAFLHDSITTNVNLKNPSVMIKRGYAFKYEKFSIIRPGKDEILKVEISWVSHEEFIKWIATQ